MYEVSVYAQEHTTIITVRSSHVLMMGLLIKRINSFTRSHSWLCERRPGYVELTL